MGVCLNYLALLHACTLHDTDIDIDDEINQFALHPRMLELEFMLLA